MGALSLRSTGIWYEVYLGGRKLGVTPLIRAPVPAGRHVIELRHPATGERRELVVTIEPGKETRRTVEGR